MFIGYTLNETAQQAAIEQAACSREREEMSQKYQHQCKCTFVLNSPSNCRTSCIALFVGLSELLYQAQSELKLTMSLYVNENGSKLHIMYSFHLTYIINI